MTVVDLIQERGPLTVAAFMELALYDPRNGYYARAAQRSGRAGDFFTSVDVGAFFGELLEVQLAEMVGILDGAAVEDPTEGRREALPKTPAAFDLIEAGAGNGRLSRDILRAAHARHPELYRRLRLHLVESSPTARAAQRTTLGDMADRLASSGPHPPASFTGVVVANELLDAMPVHQVVVREGELREVYVGISSGRLAAIEGPPSTPALAAYLDRLGITLEDNWRAEINLNATAWVAEIARRLRRGFVIIIDYGHEASDLYSVAHAGGTLTTFSGHRARGSESAAPAWLERPGDQDLTAHVDFTSVRMTAEREGLVTLGFLDQTYFLMGLLDPAVLAEPDPSVSGLRRRLALKTLLMPGGLGSTMKVMVFGKRVGAPLLLGCSQQVRVT